MNEVKVNRIVPYKGKFYQIVNELGCSKCSFCNDDCNDIQNDVSQCSCQVRSDKTEVIFEELPKHKDNVSVNEVITFGGMKVKAIKGTNCVHCDFKDVCKAYNINKKDYVATINNYFGYCSSMNRNDDKDVIFKIVDNNLLYIPSTGGIEQGTNEVSTNRNEADTSDIISNKVTDVITPHVIDGECNNIEINNPDGFAIDIDASDLNKGIIIFKPLYISYSDILNKLYESNNVSDAISDYANAIHKLENIARYYNECNHINLDKSKYIICFDKQNNEYFVHTVIQFDYGLPVFNSEANARKVIDNPELRSILDAIFIH